MRMRALGLWLLVSSTAQAVDEDLIFWKRFLGPESLSMLPSAAPSETANVVASNAPSVQVSNEPSWAPTTVPSASPSMATDFPSSSPSGTIATGAPSIAPSSIVSAVPTLDTAASNTPTTVSNPPTEAPSLSISVSPTTTDSALPTMDIVSSTPTESPSVGLTEIPSASPSTTVSPTTQDSALPTMDSLSSMPTATPTESPSVADSAPPTAASSAPTESPSSSPTDATASNAPTSSEAPTTDTPVDCSIDIDVTCQLLDGRPCNSSSLDATACPTRPTAVTLLYTGRLCNESSTLQNFFACEDFADQPSTVQVMAQSGSTLLDGVVVSPGEVLVLRNDGMRLSGSVTVSILDPTTMMLLQQSMWDASCSSPLFVGDSFGAMQVLGWETSLGSTSSLQEGVVEWTITPSQDVELVSLTSSVAVNVTGVVGTMIPSGMSLVVSSNDATVNLLDLPIETEVTGVTSSGGLCVGSDP